MTVEPLELLSPSLTPAFEYAADEDWQTVAMSYVVSRAGTGRPFQAWDLIADGCPEPDDPAHDWGPLMSLAARDGVIRCCGAEPSRRPTVRGSLTRVWIGA